jgi:hypothetical protein
MANMFTQISSEAFKNIQRGAGMILNKFDPAKPAKPADADIVCATTGGIQASCVATYVDDGEDIDNVPNNTKELKQLESWECKMSFTMVTMTAAALKLALGAATVSGNKIVPKAALESTDFTDTLWWVGDMGDGGLAAICLKNVLSSGGFSLQTTKNGKGQVSVELLGHVSISTLDEVPMEFYVQETIAA